MTGSSINAPVEEVGKWLVQIGQDRAGFYSDDVLERLVLADIHNVDRIVPEWQELEAGDTVRLASKRVRRCSKERAEKRSGVPARDSVCHAGAA